jgi:hypothetical protein
VTESSTPPPFGAQTPSNAISQSAESKKSSGPFSPDNPWTSKLTSHPQFGWYPAPALTLLREISAYEDELLLFAVPCGRFDTKGGYLLCTTQHLRWIQTSPTRADLFWSLSAAISEVGWTFFWLNDGTQFEMPKKAMTEKFTMKEFGELYRMVQQEAVWEKSHTVQPVNVVSNSSSAELNIADQLTKLADLFDRGVLTEKEFSEAKSRILG